MHPLSTFVRMIIVAGALALLSFAAPANATPTTWNLTSGCKFTNYSSFPGHGFNSSTGCLADSQPAYDNVDGNIDSFTSTSGNKSLKAEAYHLNTVTQQVCTTTKGKTTCTNQQVNPNPYDTNQKLQKDFLGYYGSNGLGVENLSSPDHTVDNKAGYDFVVFQLPAGNYNKLTITLYDNTAWGGTKDMNATVLFGTPDASLGPVTSTDSFYQKSVTQLLNGGFSSMTTTGLFLGSNQSSGTKTITIDSWNPITYFIVAASLTDPNVANFKIKSIVTDYVVRVPEPASYAAFGAGLLGLAGWAARRRRTVKRA